FVISPYASIRRSRRKGQCVRTTSIRPRSHWAVRICSSSCSAFANKLPLGSLTNEPPQNCSDPSRPTRLGAAMKTPLAVACERILGNVHLAIESRLRAVGVEHDGRIVIQARRASLKQ